MTQNKTTNYSCLMIKGIISFRTLKMSRKLICKIANIFSFLLRQILSGVNICRDCLEKWSCAFLILQSKTERNQN